MKELFLYGALAVALVLGVLGVSQESVVVERPAGAVAGPDHYEHQNFLAGATHGGRVVSTSTSNASATLLASDIANTRGQYTSLLKVTPNGANLTLTLPATSTMPYIIPEAGDCYTLKLENAATAATTTTIAAGTGIDLQEVDGGNVVIGQNNYANIEFCRDSTTDIIVTVTETIPAD